VKLGIFAGLCLTFAGAFAALAYLSPNRLDWWVTIFSASFCFASAIVDSLFTERAARNDPDLVDYWKRM